jgi:hypothetical protein
MAYVLFVSEQRLKETTAITSNVDVEFLLPYLKIAQRKYIEVALGTDLYEKLQSDITGGTLGGAYQTLVNDYISDALSHFAFYEALPFMHYKIMNKAVVLKNSDNSSPVTREELQDLRNDILDTAEWYRKRLIDYICNNESSFPEYNTNTGADISPDKTAYTSAMNLDRRVQGNTSRARIALNDFLEAYMKY